MRRTLAIIILIGSVAAAPAAAQDAAPAPPTIAKRLARAYIAPLTRPGSARVAVSVPRCHDLGRWTGCRIHVRGTATCNGILRYRDAGENYIAWVPRLRCR